MESGEDGSLRDTILDIPDEEIAKDRNPPCDSVTRFDDLPSYDYIFRNFLLRNVPFILGKRATEKWKSRRHWVTIDGKPDLKFLRDNFGESTVPVANCKQEKYSAQPKSEMTLGEYLQYWESYIDAGYPTDMENLYLKDWHFTRFFPSYQAYETPPYFTSDWLNEFWDTRSDEEDDYRFVYMGPKGTWTPFHADVFRSYSWSANICGRKKWILFPCGQEENLKDRFGNLVYNIDSPDTKDPQKFPRYERVTGRLEVYQEQGEIIYVPSGWHHQVHNVEDTISINHNWINGCNIDICWRFLLSNLQDVQREIQDCLGMEGWGTQCQMILKASSGIDFLEFYSFICVVARSRLRAAARWTTGKPRKPADTENFESKTGENLSEGLERIRIIDSQRIILQSERNKFGDTEHSSEMRVKTEDGAPKDCNCGNKPHIRFQEGYFFSACSGGANIGGNKENNSEFRICFDISDSEELPETDSIADPPGDAVKQSENNCKCSECDINQIYSKEFPEMDSIADTPGGAVKQSENNCSECDINQVLFDIKRLIYVLSLMLELEHFSSLDFSECEISPLLLLQSLQCLRSKYSEEI